MQRSDLIKYFMRVRELTENICKPLEYEDFVVQPIEDVSPPKWHLGHTTWFFEVVLLDKFDKEYKAYHPLYSYIFNSYYQTFGDMWARPRRGVLSRPTVKEVFDYRSTVTDCMIDLIDSIDDKQWDEFSNLVVLGLNHEQQHQELLVTDIKYIYSSNPLNPVYIEKSADLPDEYKTSFDYSRAEFIEFEGGMHEIGFTEEGFCYDNEKPSHKLYINKFKLQNRLVTNSDYLCFIEDGGYKDFKHWLSDGWETVQREGWKAPLNWRKIENEWYEMTLTGLCKLLPIAPVTHVSYYEADAYAKWAGKRLPTEYEWEAAANRSEVQPSHGNFWHDKNFHPMPVNESLVLSGKKLFQMLGDVWEWTSSAYLPYPGYQHQQGALGEYNSKFMINQMVLRGGSCATSRNHIRTTYRNFFHPDKRWQFTGFRLADNNF